MTRAFHPLHPPTVPCELNKITDTIPCYLVSCVRVCVCVYVCVYARARARVLIKLHITAQSGPAILLILLVILRHSLCMCVFVCVHNFATTRQHSQRDVLLLIIAPHKDNTRLFRLHGHGQDLPDARSAAGATPPSSLRLGLPRQPDHATYFIFSKDGG